VPSRHTRGGRRDTCRFYRPGNRLAFVCPFKWGPMQITFSQAADMILSRHEEFREGLLQVLGGSVAGHCFIDGRIGRTPADDELVLRRQDHSPITIPYHEFADRAAIKRIIEEWPSASPS
jgi:hypothetical protein